MRRVDSEGDSQSSRNRKRDASRSSSAQKHHLRRLALERLEVRTLLSTSTLPSPVTQLQSFVGEGITSAAASTSSPSVAIDPLNPQKLVAAWTTYDPTTLLDGSGGQVTTYVQGAYSIDGGQTWNELPGDTDADVQLDFSVAPVTSGRQPDFAVTQDATVAFDRNENAYLLTSTSDAAGTSGVLDLQKWNFSSQTPKQDAFTDPSYDSLAGSFLGPPDTVNPIYRWQGGDGALVPTLAVDSNAASFTDGTTTQTDASSGNVYVAWESNDAPRKGDTAGTTYNPNDIKLMSSSDGGQDFSYQAYLEGHEAGNLFDQPKLAISQGSATVPGGQVTVVYDNAGPGGGPGATAPYFDEVLTKADTTGGTVQQFNSSTDIAVANPGATDVPITVGINAANFNSLSNLTVKLSLSDPTLANTSAVLVSPGGTSVTLWNNGTNATGAATNLGGTITGANLGQSTLTPYIGTTLDSTAFRSLSVDGTAPYTGIFQPFGDLQGTFAGKSAAQLDGTWHLIITQYEAQTITAPTPEPAVIGAALNFTSGLSSVTDSDTNMVTTTYLNSGGHPFTDGIQAIPVFADPSIASDDTLGSNSPFQGRLYVAVADDNFNAATLAYTTSTFITLFYSDDGGTTWSYEGIVNDDNGLTDGFSTGGYAQPGTGTIDGEASESTVLLAFSDPEANVRPKIEPQVAVDSDTGTVVVTFLDTRNDAAAVRVANYIAVSSDGGNSFAPETYANPSQTAVNAITGATENLGPIPDNESSGGNNQETHFGFGQSQGLAVLNGLIVPVWSSNENAGSASLNIKQSLFIESAQVTYAAGPRVIASTQGPVGQPGDEVNTDREADGTPIANTIVLTFDRAVDPATFPADGSTIGNSPLQVFYNNPDGTAAPIPLRVLSVTPDSTDTIYTITFDPTNPATGLPYGVGTYSYDLRPLVKGMVPYQAILATDEAQQVPYIDTAADGGEASFTISSHPGITLSTATLSAKIDVYQKGTTPVNSPSDVQIYLIAQDGTQYLLSEASTFSTPENGTIDVSNSITIPAADDQPLDQIYTIKVVDHVAGEEVFLYNDVNSDSFDFQVKLNNQITTTFTGNYLDQNANGTPGETPGDVYSVPDGQDTLPLVVPGPHVASTAVVNSSGTTISTGTDNLVNDNNASSINVTFDREMQVASFTPAQVLSVTGPTGRIDGPQTFPSTGTAKSYSTSGPYQLIPKAGTLTSSILISNTGLDVSSLNVQVDIVDPNDASLALTLVAPDGTKVPLVVAGTASGANFTDTIFSDSAAANGQTSTIPGASAPYSLTYSPASPLGALSGKLLDGTWELLVTDSTAAGTPQGRLNSWSLNVTPQVPTGPGTQLNSSLVISSYPDNSFKIAHLAVQLSIDSTKDSDLQVYLVAPNGTTVIPLILNVGGTSGTNTNFTGTILDDDATIPIASGVAPFNLSYQPAGSLSQLDGMSIEGTWTLRVVSATADSTVSTLTAWSLIATPQLTVTPVNPTTSTSGEQQAETFTVGFPTQTLSGTYSIILSPTISSVAPNPANPTDPGAGTPLDTNLNAGVDALEGISTGATTTIKYAATSVPLTIPYAEVSPIGPTVNGVLNSQINVPDNFPIQGDVGTVAGLTVTINITYYYDPDLQVTLEAPDGKSIILFEDIGKGATTADFTNTTLSDTTTPLAPIQNAGAPFFGTFNPQESLASFVTDNGGAQAFSKGLWTLTITNMGQDPGPTIDGEYPPTLLGWSMSFQKPQVSTGLGEAVADQATVGFRLFNFAPSNPLSNDTWTAVGPAGTSAAANPNNTTGGAATGADLGGPVSVVALDPSDPSGNTAYIGASSGGVWKTTDFLTTSPSGPTYIPLTNFGPNYSVNIGGLAVFGRNDSPSQSIIFAGTGDGQATTATAGNSVYGVGILRSEDGGASFTLLDSTENVYPAVYPTTYPNGTAVPSNLVGTALPAGVVGTILPENSPFRDHVFVGTTTYQIVVDPTPLPGGGIIVYAALGGVNGGLWRSIDGGNTWQNLSAATIPQVNGENAAATDVILDPASASASTGNLDILYAAFQGVGVYMSSNQGLGLSEMLGNVGADNLIQDTQALPAVPLKVPDANTPNGDFGRIVLAKPALTTDAAQNLNYQDWLYAAVLNTNGTFRGLYVTKDRGENWTLAQIASQTTPAYAVTEGLPTNNNLETNNYDVAQGATSQTHNGNSAFSLAVDPTNPNIVYLGGTQDYQSSGLIRVDLTGMYDAHAFVPFASNLNDGGKLAYDAAGRVNVAVPADGDPIFQGDNPNSDGNGLYYLDLRHSPTNPYLINSTQYVFNSTAFSNDGYGVTWTPIDSTYDSPLDGSTNIHQILSILDPLTGLTRLIFADDQGVFTGLYNADGTLDTTGIGTAAAVTGSLNGNLQDEELYYSAAQPSALAAETAGALFYGSGFGMTDVQSASDELSTGNLTWTVQGVSYGDLQDGIQTNDRGGTGIATNQTGGVSATNPGGSPALYEYDVPFLGGDTTNFFRVQNLGQTTGLVNNYQAEFPANNVLTNGNGVSQLGNFTVNPINGAQILISSNLGNLYETTNTGAQWLQIGSGANDFDGTYAPALAYGAPDPNAPNGVGNLDNFIYVGTEGGHIYVTESGGGPWTNISAGLDGSSVVSIYTNPNRGSHQAYAVTLDGVYFMADSTAANATWVNITGNLTQIQSNAFGNPAFAQNALLSYDSSTGQLGGFRAIVADYRYAVPDPVTPTTTYPVLYVSGYGGVFRSLDNGTTWTLFPNTSFDAAPVNGGYLPSVDVTSLSLNLGAVNPATGHATEVAGDPEVLLASTLGLGDYAIRLAPDVLPGTVSLDLTTPTPGGSDSGAVRGYPGVTNVISPVIDGVSEISNYGNTVTITLIDEANGIVIGTGTTDPFGHFKIQVVSNVATIDPSFAIDGVKNVGIQATDSSGAKGNIFTFTYTLKHTPPAAPTNFKLTAASDSGRFNNDAKTNVTTPTFTVSTLEPATTEVELIRYNPSKPTGQQFEVVDTEMAGASKVTLTDKLLATDFPGQIDMQFVYFALQIDLANNPSTPLNEIAHDPAVFVVTVDNIPPPPPTSITLDPSSKTGSAANTTNQTHPFFDVTGLLANDNLELFRSSAGSTPILVGTAAVGVTKIQDATGVTTGGVYSYTVAQVDVYGNVSVLSMSPTIAVTVNTQAPAIPTIVLYALDDSGAPSHPDVTNVRSPRFNGTGTAGLKLTVLAYLNGTYLTGTLSSVAITTVAANGTYLAQLPDALADGNYMVYAVITNAAGNSSISSALAVTIKANGPQVVPTLAILPADDTGIKGDGVTADHRPSFIGTADPGDLVTLYSIINGQLSTPQAKATASTVNGSFTFQLPLSLTDGTTELVAQATDIAGNTGPLGTPLSVRIISVAGDYAGTGAAQLAVFNPSNEAYYVQNVGGVQVSTTPGQDVPVQYDFTGDGKTDFVGYNYSSATYAGTLSNGSSLGQQFGTPSEALPVSGYFGSTGTFIYSAYNPSTATWSTALPQANGQVVQFGAANVDIPVPAAYDGGGVTEIATFRPTTLQGGDADSFNVLNANGSYQVSFTSPAVAKLGFVYKAGDIPAPADYDGVGRDEFAVYRPSTGQFFILNTPNPINPSTWTLRTVTLNLPGGPNASDEPVSEDYDGNGKADPTVYRPGNSTFYMIHSSTGVQQNIQFGTPGGSIAAAGPLLYRLTALQGSPVTIGSGGSGGLGTGGGGNLAAHSIVSATATTSTSSSSAVPTLIAVASPMVLTSPPASAATVVSTPSANLAVTVGASTPKSVVTTVAPTKSDATEVAQYGKITKAKKVTKPLVVDHKAPVVETKTQVQHPKAKATTTRKSVVVSHVLHSLLSAKKGHKA